MRLVDADCLINSLKLYPCGSVIGAIEQAPTVDTVPVRHGKWINCEWVESGFKFVSCSECNHADMDSRLYKYCPWCGARMDEEADDE